MMRGLLLLPLLQYDKPPTLEKLEVALSQVKARKAGGLSGIGLWPILLFKLLALMKDVCLKCLVCIGWLLTSLWPERCSGGSKGVSRFPRKPHAHNCGRVG